MTGPFSFEFLKGVITIRIEWTAEEKAMYEENVAARPFYDGDRLRALWAAVTMQAIKDYKDAVKYNFRGTARECEAYFESEAFSWLSNGWGLKEIRKLVTQQIEEETKAREKYIRSHD